MRAHAHAHACTRKAGSKAWVRAATRLARPKELDSRGVRRRNAVVGDHGLHFRARPFMDSARVLSSRWHGGGFFREERGGVLRAGKGWAGRGRGAQCAPSCCSRLFPRLSAIQVKNLKRILSRNV